MDISNENYGFNGQDEDEFSGLFGSEPPDLSHVTAAEWRKWWRKEQEEKSAVALAKDVLAAPAPAPAPVPLIPLSNSDGSGSSAKKAGFAVAGLLLLVLAGVAWKSSSNKSRLQRVQGTPNTAPIASVN